MIGVNAVPVDTPATHNSKRLGNFHCHKGIGLVSQVFNCEDALTPLVGGILDCFVGVLVVTYEAHGFAW
jgi:hypothetical protein